MRSDLYFKWLCDLITVNQRNRSYFLLAQKLHSKDFSWSVPNDDNRAFEGVALRERFCDEEDFVYTSKFLNGRPCSMLELIIALAYRCENIMADQNDSMEMRDWFWELIRNANLDVYMDECYYDICSTYLIEDILNQIINRTYKRNGKGGLFPLKFSKKDQRKVELWYQMSSYLVENYYIKDLCV